MSGFTTSTLTGVELAPGVGEWMESFAKAQAEFPNVPKGQKATIPMKSGGEFSYTYAALPDVLEAVRPILEANGFAVAQSVAGDRDTIAVTTRIYHKAGHMESFGPLVLHSGGDARSAGSAITYARRYALCAALGIAPDEDDDGARAAAARRDEPTMSEADVAWAWVWQESKVLKAWSDADRLAAAELAQTYLAIKKVSNMDEARRVFDHMTGQYAERPIDQLPLEKEKKEK